jgi:hypothetical protein
LPVILLANRVDQLWLANALPAEGALRNDLVALVSILVHHTIRRFDGLFELRRKQLAFAARALL